MVVLLKKKEKETKRFSSAFCRHIFLVIFLEKSNPSDRIFENSNSMLRATFNREATAA